MKACSWSECCPERVHSESVSTWRDQSSSTRRWCVLTFSPDYRRNKTISGSICRDGCTDRRWFSGVVLWAGSQSRASVRNTRLPEFSSSVAGRQRVITSCRCWRMTQSTVPHHRSPAAGEMGADVPTSGNQPPRRSLEPLL